MFHPINVKEYDELTEGAGAAEQPSAPFSFCGVSVGADPEFEIISRAGWLVRAASLLGGKSLSDPVGSDGTGDQLELRPSPSTDPRVLYARIRSLANSFISGPGEGHVLLLSGSRLPLGCHIHIGGYDLRERFPEIVSAIDSYPTPFGELGDLMLRISGAARGRYARRAAYEVKRYGGEYRTPPASILCFEATFVYVASVCMKLAGADIEVPPFPREKFEALLSLVEGGAEFSWDGQVIAWPQPSWGEENSWPEEEASWQEDWPQPSWQDSWYNSCPDTSWQEDSWAEHVITSFFDEIIRRPDENTRALENARREWLARGQTVRQPRIALEGSIWSSAWRAFEAQPGEKADFRLIPYSRIDWWRARPLGHMFFFGWRVGDAYAVHPNLEVSSDRKMVAAVAATIAGLIE